MLVRLRLSLPGRSKTARLVETQPSMTKRMCRASMCFAKWLRRSRLMPRLTSFAGVQSYGIRKISWRRDKISLAYVISSKGTDQLGAGGQDGGLEGDEDQKAVRVGHVELQELA
jgi:hypothetical protein